MRRRGVFLAILFSLTAALSAGAGEPPPQLVPLGEKVPQPRRFGLDEIEALPTREVHCPVCEFPVAVPRINALMRGVSPGPWAMHAAARDSDLCPFPGPGKIAFQADIVVCPVCGYAAKHHHFAEAVPAELAQWVTSALKPNLRAVQTRLLGRRVEDMSEDEIVAFFNNQADIPDRLRTEHARIVAAARRAPFLERAELT